MRSKQASYQPISCELHDLLEARATARQPVPLRFVDADGTVQLRSAGIADVFAREGAEYLVLSTGENLRLDRLVEVDGISFRALEAASQPCSVM
ncbi:MAG TPA: hypothetical protein VGE47_07545 [Burkholderiaceae bacterium]